MLSINHNDEKGLFISGDLARKTKKTKKHKEKAKANNPQKTL